MWQIPDKVHMTICRYVIRMRTVCVAIIWTQEANADIGQRAAHTWCAALLLRPREALSVTLHTHIDWATVWTRTQDWNVYLWVPYDPQMPRRQLPQMPDERIYAGSLGGGLGVELLYSGHKNSTVTKPRQRGALGPKRGQNTKEEYE
jgi:hypothetical protein